MPSDPPPAVNPQGVVQLGGQWDQAFTRPGSASGQLTVGLQLSNWHLLQRPLFGFLDPSEPSFAIQISFPYTLSAQLAWNWWKHSYHALGNQIDLSMQSQISATYANDPGRSQFLVQFLQGQANYNFGQSGMSLYLQANLYHTWNDDSSHYMGAQGVVGFQWQFDLR